MELRDSRRLTGPHLLAAVPGAVLDVSLADNEPAAPLVEAWAEQAQRLLAAVGWPASELASRSFPGGASLFLSAPIDALYAATEVNEWAFEAALAVLDGQRAPRVEAAASRLRLVIAEEENPALRELERAAAEHAVSLLSDDSEVSLGLGGGSRTFPVDALPAAAAVAWGTLHDIPVAVVTGTNGKTTTVRMLAAIAAAAGRRAGYTSTDGIVVDGATVEAGDWSGPGGARRLLRQPALELAVLECARGGILRRGLPVRRAEVAVITNVAADHLGEWGVNSLEDLADAKWVVARVADHLVVNQDDALLAARAAGHPGRLTGVSPSGGAQRPVRWRVADGDLVREEAGGPVAVVRVDELPTALGGAARHNVANALAAAAAAHALGLSDAAIRSGLAGLQDNPGRLEVFEVAGVRVLVDFAHNPHGLEALAATVRALAPQRWLLTLGQAGDRSDADLEALARTAAAAAPDRILVKELLHHLRGRVAGEVPARLRAALSEAGYPDRQVETVDSEMDSVRVALDWARPGDVLLLLTVAERSAVRSFLQRRQTAGS